MKAVVNNWHTVSIGLAIVLAAFAFFLLMAMHISFTFWHLQQFFVCISLRNSDILVVFY